MNPTRKHFALMNTINSRGVAPERLYFGNELLFLDLISWGMVINTSYSGKYHSYSLSDLGLQALAENRAKHKASRAPHNDLASHLAQHLREHKNCVTWENIQFDLGKQKVRPDVYAMNCTLNPKNIVPTVYEIKVSRSDFLSDISKPEKRAGYFQIAHKVYYACVDGLIEKSEVPKECGLIVQNKHGSDYWTVVKGAKTFPTELSVPHWMNLVIKKSNKDKEA